MDNKQLKERLHKWCKSAAKELPTCTADESRAVTWEANGPVWWSNHAGQKCIGITVRGYIQQWSGTIRINLIIDLEGKYFVLPKMPGNYGYIRDEAAKVFQGKIPEQAHPLIGHLEKWKAALIADIQKLEFSEVNMLNDLDAKAFFTIHHPEIPKLAVTVDLDYDSFDVSFGPGCKAHPMAKMLAESLRRVERDVVCKSETVE